MNFHPDFKLNQTSFSSVEGVLVFAKNNIPEIVPFLQQWFANNDFIEVQTSGSTGMPKMIKIRKKAMIYSAKATGAFFHLPEKTKALLCMSPNYIAGKMMLVRALILGWWLDVIPPSSNPLQSINTLYDFSAMVPLQVHHSLSKLNFIKTLLVGGGAIPNSLIQQFYKVNTKIYATYGMTETITHIAAKEVHPNPEDGYQLLPNIAITTDQRGCLVIHAPNIFKKPIITNDLVNVMSNTSFEWLGRYDSIINSGGVKLIPEKIEKKLTTLISSRFFISSAPDVVLGEKLILLVEGKEDVSLLSKIRELPTLDAYEVPKKIYFLPQFIETPTQKIQRQKTVNLLL